MRKANFVTVAGRDQTTADFLKDLRQSTVIFAITEPDLVTFVPVVSPLKMGTLIDVLEGQIIKIKLRQDFMPSSEEEEMLL